MGLPIPDALMGVVDDATAAALRALRDYEPEPNYDATSMLTTDVLKAAGFGGPRDMYPLAEELTPTQRAVVEFLASQDVVLKFAGASTPSSPWKLRRWLGMDASGVLERFFELEGPDGVRRREALWQTLLRVHWARGELRDVVDGLGLTVPETLEVFADVYLNTYDLSLSGPRPQGWVPAEAIDASCGPWALATAKRLLAHHRQDLVIKVPVLLGLVRSGTPLEPSWERLMFADPEQIPLMMECLEAFPPDRQDAILADAVVVDTGFAYETVRCALAVLQVRPSREVGEVVVAYAEKATQGLKKSRVTRTELKRAMKPLAAAHPAVAEVWERHLAGVPTAAPLEVLTVEAVRSAADLSPQRRAQVEAFAATYDGHEMALDKRLRAGPDQEWSFRGLELRTLRDARDGQTYTAVLLGPDSGAVFSGDTTDEVAGLLQGSITCQDAALLAGLRDALKG